MTKKSMKTKKRANHHDMFFKDGYSDPRFAGELFRLAMTEEEFSAFNWDSLRPEKDTFQGLKDIFQVQSLTADLLFSVTLKSHPNERVRICLLVEHKSLFSQEVYYQILGYIVSIIGKTLLEKKEAWPVFSFLFHHGKKPWPGSKSLKKGLFGGILSKIPATLAKDMLDYGLRVVDTHSPEVERAIRDKNIESRGFLNILKRNWSLESDVEELKKAFSLFDNWPGDKENLSVILGNYIWAVVPGMTKELWEELERYCVRQGIFSKGGYMNTREYIKEEGRQEGIQKGIQRGIQRGIQKERRQVVLNMLQNKFDSASISKATGLSIEEIKKLQNEEN